MIRRINIDDLEIIYTLGEKYNSNFRKVYNLESYLNNSIYLLFCYEEDRVIKGFIIATIMSNVVEILLVFVDHYYRRQNIGWKLLDSVEKKGENSILEVSTQNIPAYNLYKKRNYVEISRRKGYYNGVDAIVMKK